jgi:protein-S-isoprenylcysteine O-methyltransferase
MLDWCVVGCAGRGADSQRQGVGGVRLQFMWSLHMAILAVFHALEFFSQALYKPLDLSAECTYRAALSRSPTSAHAFPGRPLPGVSWCAAFVLDHSVEYGVAFAISVAEFLLESWLVPSLKHAAWVVPVSLVGAALACIGLAIRFVAVATAGDSFSHLVEIEERRPTHSLVQHGIYAFCRHPAYAGWWLYAVSMQLVLLNPISAPLFAYAATRFFRTRLDIEEPALLKFFGAEYVHYARRVPLGTGIPFVPNSLSIQEALRKDS